MGRYQLIQESEDLTARAIGHSAILDQMALLVDSLLWQGTIGKLAHQRVIEDIEATRQGVQELRTDLAHLRREVAQWQRGSAGKGGGTPPMW